MNAPLRVFVSSTSKDLYHFRLAVLEEVGRQEWLPDAMENFGATPHPVVEECLRRVRSSDLMILLVARKRGWVPTPEQGGDGTSSITALELCAARELWIPVYVLMADEKRWPGHLWEDDQQARAWVQQFRAGIGQSAEFFDVEGWEGDNPLPGRDFHAKVCQTLLRHRERFASAFDGLLPPLRGILREVCLSREEVADAYRLCAPAEWEPTPRNTGPNELLLFCAESLSRASCQSATGQFPLLSFLHALLGRLGERQTNELRDWLAQAVRHLGPQAPSEPSSTPLPAESSLLIQVSPSRFDPTVYHVKAWLRAAGRPACLLDGDGTHVPEELPGVLERLWPELEDQGIAFDDLWVEFILPRKLLCADVDRWAVVRGLLGRVPVGVESRVVVRPLERQRRTSPAARALQARWKAMQGLADRPCRVGTVPRVEELLSCSALHLGEAQRGQRLYGLLGNVPAIVCVVCGRPPNPAPVPNQPDEFDALVEAGVPVVLWLRREAGESMPAACAALLLDLERVPLCQLPAHVQGLRRAALSCEESNHPGWHTALLWDNPTRPSPDHDPEHQLRPPQPAR